MLIPLIPTRLHGAMDYLYGIVMMALPWILGFSQYSGALWVMFMLGIIVIIFSLMTRYELGYVGLISMRMHLWFDLLMGIFLIASPWLIDFHQYVYLPHGNGRNKCDCSNFFSVNATGGTWSTITSR